MTHSEEEVNLDWKEIVLHFWWHVYNSICFAFTIHDPSRKLPTRVFSYALLISLQTMRSTCSRLPSHWMLRHTAGKMWPSTLKAQWLTCSTGLKNRTMWRTWWPTLPVWSPIGSARPTPTATPQVGVPTHPRPSCLAFLVSSVYSDDPNNKQTQTVHCMPAAIQTLYALNINTNTFTVCTQDGKSQCRDKS